jgi:uncharacterized protein (TIGR02284 family)
MLHKKGSGIMVGDRTAGTLNHLIAVCRDAEVFYGYAAGKVSGWQLPPLLRATASLHREIGQGLRTQVRGAGATPAERGTLAGTLRRLKGGLKATLTADTEAVLVLALQDTEQTVVEAFESALTGPIDAAARRRLADQLKVLKATHERIGEIARRAAA